MHPAQEIVARAGCFFECFLGSFHAGLQGLYSAGSEKLHSLACFQANHLTHSLLEILSVLFCADKSRQKARLYHSKAAKNVLLYIYFYSRKNYSTFQPSHVSRWVSKQKWLKGLIFKPFSTVQPFSRRKQSLTLENRSLRLENRSLRLENQSAALAMGPRTVGLHGADLRDVQAMAQRVSSLNGAEGFEF